MKCSFCFLEMAAQDNKISSRIDELDALRGIAAILVVIFHCTMLHDAYTFTYGAAGVELFFIISGFVIFMTLNHVRSAKDFVINRFARLYPIYWFCVLLTFILMLFHNNMGNNTTATSPPYFQLAANMTMMQRYFGIQDLDGPYWSLAVELAFYAVMLLLYTYKAIKKTIHVLMAVMAVEFAVALATQNFPANGVLTGISVCSNYLYLIHFLPLFLSGVIFYHIYTEGGTTSRYIGILFCYLAQIADPAWPRIETRLALVDQARENLRRVVRGLPARERVYGEIRAGNNLLARFHRHAICFSRRFVFTKRS